MVIPLSIIKKQYDTFAEEYRDDLDNSMQLVSLKKLFNYLIAIESKVLNKKWLDAGCGPGSLSKLKNIFFPKVMIGVDLSGRMIEISQKSGFYNRCYKADITNLFFLKDGSIQVYFSNSVFHWLNLVNDVFFQKSVEEAYRVLEYGGFIAVSLSGIGTAHQFMDAYKKVIDENKSCVNPDLVRDDILGSENLFRIVDLFEEAGFYVEFARLEFEPVEYDNPSKYVLAVKKYGKEIYLMPFQHLPDESKDKIFERIGELFVQSVGNKKYRHKQYMIYIIGKK